MKIGELALATGASVEAIRFYEREQLLPIPSRNEGNYRVYGHEHVERLAFIRHCRSLDMALDEIRVLLRFKESPGADCGGVNELLDDHIGRVAHRIGELRQLEKQLKLLREQCTAAYAASECGILKVLSNEAAASKKPVPKLAHARGVRRA